ncbi:hypothetical protein PoB_007283500 [Plakobranchus ocellatus]|uniref:Uncharacterized protein n=1 Tax=Plakobranchus ocellatus TaxID=259542 RepID=A0AAV4DQB1_9GAST|nr:hypothetical protein PoB_007283500 [Plakobranchus ocellatus]
MQKSISWDPQCGNSMRHFVMPVDKNTGIFLMVFLVRTLVAIQRGSQYCLVTKHRNFSHGIPSENPCGNSKRQPVLLSNKTQGFFSWHPQREPLWKLNKA